jgi:hypothetical protein
VALLALGLTGAACYRARFLPAEPLYPGIPESPVYGWFEPAVTRVKVTDPIAARIVAAAHAQEGDLYNASYKRISYPGGDVPKGAGACTDVVVRALRGAGYDLQKLIHEDMDRNYSKYPNLWHVDHPDPNIDHRRVPNVMRFFERHGQVLPTSVDGAALKTWQPGDIVCWKLDGNRWHTGVISDAVNEAGIPLVIHNGWVCTEQDSLTSWPIIGHYRYPSRPASVARPIVEQDAAQSL